MSETNNIIDLTRRIEAGMPIWPDYPEIELWTSHWVARDGFTMERTELATHTSTHIDAPRHFIERGTTIDEYPISKFFGTGVVLDLAGRESGEPITESELSPFIDSLESVDVAMLHTGWDQYYGKTTEWVFEFPFLTADAASLLGSLDLDAVGIDTPSVGGWTGEAPAHGPTTEISAASSHLPLLENDVLPVEELTNLDAVLDGADARKAEFGYLPLRFDEAGGSPVRAFARV